MKSIATLLLAVITNMSFAQFTLVKDFDMTSASTFSYNSDDGFLASLGSKVFVRYDTIVPGPEYKTLLSTLTITGAREKIVLATSVDESVVPMFYDFKLLPNNKIAFIVRDGSTNKIIQTDGTAAGTIELLSTTEYISGMEVITNGLFFTRQKESSSDYELEKIDLTTYAVTNVADLGWFYSISDLSKTDDNTLIFLASDPANSNHLSVYKSDGTSGGTAVVKDIYSGNGVSQQTVMTQVGSNVYFFYKENGVDCCNFLWVTDGTLAGTTKLKEFNMVSFVDYDRYVMAKGWNNKFYFMAVDNGGNSNNDRVLWVSDGTTPGTIALNTSATFTRPKYLTSFNSKLYFIGYDANTYNYRLYMTDGTSLGTTQVANQFGGTNLYAYELATDGTYIYMAADIYAYGAEIFRYDGVNTECLISEGVSSTGTADPKNLIVNGTDLFFTAELTATGREVYTATTFTSITDAVIEMSSTNSYVFPNPARNQVEVKTDLPVSHITLINSHGVEIAKSNSPTMNVSAYPAGVYQLKVVLLNDNVMYQKLIIME